MQFQTPLIPARLIKRYKRFLADVQLSDGSVVTAHCANPGSMMGLIEPDTKVWIEPNDEPRKKLKYAWRLIERDDGTMIGIDTAAANRIVKEALEQSQIPIDFDHFQPEVKYGDGSRVDFLLTGPDGAKTFLEVKSVTLSRQVGVAEFPDSVTARGTKHLSALVDQIAQGDRAVLLYLIQRTDCTSCRVAGDIDPTYAATMADATKKGLEVLCFDTHITPERLSLGTAVPYISSARIKI
jgi:sugar fermentation stimulation protein A